MAANDNTKTAAYENYPNNPLMGGAKTYLASAQNVNQQIPVEVQGAHELAVEVSLKTSSAAGDLVVEVLDVMMDGSVMSTPIAPIRSTGPTLTGSTVYFSAQYDVSGHTRVVIQVRNTNAAARDITVNWAQTSG